MAVVINNDNKEKKKTQVIHNTIARHLLIDARPHLGDAQFVFWAGFPMLWDIPPASLGHLSWPWVPPRFFVYLLTGRA